MNKPASYSILVVDDKPDQSPLRLEDEVLVIAPWNLKEEHLKTARVALIDYALTEEWNGVGPAQDEKPQLDSVPYPCQPRDGLALASVIRAHLRELESTNQLKVPTAVALLSARLGDLIERERARGHIIGHLYGLEWAFDKVQPPKEPALILQVRSLSAAIGRLGEVERPEENDFPLAQLLQVPDEQWAEIALDDVSACHPPQHELARAVDGVPVIRWLLHRVLPYPCFLWDDMRVAARMGVAPEWFREAVDATPLATEFQSARYGGVLSNFFGRRWWAAGIEDRLWAVLNERTDNPNALIDWLHEVTQQEVKQAGVTQPIVCFGPDHQPLESLVSRDDAVRIRPDDWPPFAHDAWARIVDVKATPSLRALVVKPDRGRLDD